MKTCSSYQDEISLYVSGDLEPESRTAFEQHCAVCPKCRDEETGYRQLLGQLQADAPADPGDIFFHRQLKNIMGALPSQIQKPKRIWLPALAAAALLFLVFGLSRYQEHRAATFDQDWRTALQVISTESDTPWGEEDLDELNDKELDTFAQELQQKILGNHQESWFEDSGDWDDLNDQQVEELLQRLQGNSMGRQT